MDICGTVNGVVWMTATMRQNFERFGGYIVLDTLKRGITNWLWPYMAIAMCNELWMVCLACEAIMCGECTNVYEFMCTFLLKNAPGGGNEQRQYCF